MFKILDPEKNIEEWRGLIDALPATRRDLHFRPEYLSVQAMLGVKPLLAVFDADGLYMMQPLIVREAKVGAMVAADIASPYGFGGPVSNKVGATGPSLWRWLDEGIRKWGEREKIASEYCVLHPMLDAHQRWSLSESGMDFTLRKQAVYIWLSMARRYRRDRIAGIAKAEQAGVVVEAVDATPKNIDIFCGLYRETMLRKQASARWFFPDEYLAAHFSKMRDRAQLFFAKIKGEVEVASMVLLGHGSAYYHLTGNAMREPKAHANDLLVDRIAAWCEDRGALRLFLGGGLSGDPKDSLLEYKAGFSSMRWPIHSYFRVLDALEYKALCAAKLIEERATLGRELESKFEPLYRRE